MTDAATGMTPDHVGIDFWLVFRTYEARMFERVRAAGFGDLTLADSDVLVHVGPDGISLSGLARARGVSKQAVQAPVRSLVARDYLRVDPDPEDARARIVRHTPRGIRMMEALAGIKRTLHREAEDAVGPSALVRLRAELAAITDALGRR